MNAYRYVGTGTDSYEMPGITPLSQCKKDVLRLSKALASRGYQTITSFDSRNTKRAILKLWSDSVQNVDPGDSCLVVWHNSSHGTQIKDTTNTEPDGMTECICCYDTVWENGTYKNVITDDEVVTLLAHVPENVTVELVLDCCNSGDMARGVLPNRRFLYPRDWKVGRITNSFKDSFVRSNSRHHFLSGTAPDKFSYETSSGGVLSSCVSRIVERSGPMPTRQNAITSIRNCVQELGYDQPASYECTEQAFQDGLFRLHGDNPDFQRRSVLDRFLDALRSLA